MVEQRVADHIRARLEPKDHNTISLREMRSSQWSVEFMSWLRVLYVRFLGDWVPFRSVARWMDPRFLRYMRNRMMLGGYRYGLLLDPNLPQFDNIGSLVERSTLYLEDGNQEHLVDIANLAMVEWVRGCCHDAPWFDPTMHPIRINPNAGRGVFQIVQGADFYRKTGDKRFLIIIAALAVIEFSEGTCHLSPHFTSVDDGYHTKQI